MKETIPTAGRPRDPSTDEAILRMAFELFIEHGLEGANFEQIAKRSGVARATIYRRWKNKEELLVAALRSVRKIEDATYTNLKKMSKAELIDHLIEVFTETLMNPDTAKFTAQLIGSIPRHPELLNIYRENLVDPLWQTVLEILNLSQVDVAPMVPDQELLLPILSGAIMHRVLMRTAPSNRATEKRWVKRLLDQVGLHKIGL